jgi:hypothetical protein
VALKRNIEITLAIAIANFLLEIKVISAQALPVLLSTLPKSVCAFPTGYDASAALRTHP